MSNAQDHNEERRSELANIWRLEGEVVVNTIRHTLGLAHRSHSAIHKDPLSRPLVMIFECFQQGKGPSRGLHQAL